MVSPPFWCRLLGREVQFNLVNAIFPAYFCYPFTAALREPRLIIVLDYPALHVADVDHQQVFYQVVPVHFAPPLVFAPSKKAGERLFWIVALLSPFIISFVVIYSLFKDPTNQSAAALL